MSGIFTNMTGEQSTIYKSKLKTLSLSLGQLLKGLGWWRIMLILVGLLAIHLIREQRQKQIDAELVARVSFAKMWDRLKQIQSVQYTRVETSPNTPNSVDVRHKVFVRGKHLKRSEFSLNQSFLEQSSRSVENRLRGFGKDAGPSVSIDNAATGKYVSVDAEERRFVEYTHRVARDLTGKLISKTEIKPNLETDHIKLFLSCLTKTQEAKKAGVETVEGKRTVVFGTERAWEGGRRLDLYWIDPQTQLPTRFEFRIFDGNTGTESARVLYSSLVFDAELDESLFDTTAPAGYKVEQDVIEGMISTPRPKPETESAVEVEPETNP